MAGPGHWAGPAPGAGGRGGINPQAAVASWSEARRARFAVTAAARGGGAPHLSRRPPATPRPGTRHPRRPAPRRPRRVITVAGAAPVRSPCASVQCVYRLRHLGGWVVAGTAPLTRCVGFRGRSPFEPSPSSAPTHQMRKPTASPPPRVRGRSPLSVIRSSRCQCTGQVALRHTPVGGAGCCARATQGLVTGVPASLFLHPISLSGPGIKMIMANPGSGSNSRSKTQIKIAEGVGIVGVTGTSADVDPAYPAGPCAMVDAP